MIIKFYLNAERSRIFKVSLKAGYCRIDFLFEKLGHLLRSTTNKRLGIKKLFQVIMNGLEVGRVSNSFD
jgi:hypothetical protein